MEDIKYPIELEVITPLSVGAGNDNEWTRGIDYIQKDGKVYVLDIQKAVANGIDIDRLTNLFLKCDEKGITLLLGNNLEKISRYVFNAPVATKNPIKTFLRTQLFDKPVVAGSSLKGSIRSALFNYLRDNEVTNEEVFGNMKEGTDFMRFVRIADIEMPATKLVNTKIFNLRKEGNSWYGGWKHGGTRDGNSHTDGKYQPTGFNTLYECIAPGKKGLGSITLAGGAFDLMIHHTNACISHADKKGELMSSDISHLFAVINGVTRTYLQKEKKFFKTYPAGRSEEIVDDIDYLISLIPDDGSSCLLKMSAGVGFHSITGDWRYSDYDDTDYWQRGKDTGKKKYKSRKIAEYAGRLQLMGFVRLCALTNNEAADFMANMEEVHEAILGERKERINQQETDRQRVLEEECQRQKTRHQQEQYMQFIRLANQFQREDKWKEALTEAEEAAAIMPEGNAHVAIIEECRSKLNILQNIQEQQIRQAEADALKYSRPLADVLTGKTSAGNLVGTTKKWVLHEGNSFGENECDAFIHAVYTLPSKEQGRLKRADLIKAVGEEWANKIIHVLNSNH